MVEEDEHESLNMSELNSFKKKPSSPPPPSKFSS